MAEYIITPEQLDRIIPEEDVQFVRNYREKYGDYPSFRKLQGGSGKKVGEVYPTHSKKDLTWSTYVQNFLGKYLDPIIEKVSKENNEELIKFGKIKITLERAKKLIDNSIERWSELDRNEKYQLRKLIQSVYQMSVQDYMKKNSLNPFRKPNLDKINRGREIPEEDIEFVRKYREKYKDYPSARSLHQGNHYVREVHPTHPKKDIKWSSYSRFLGPNLQKIVMMVSKEKGEELADIKKRGKRLLSLDKKHLFVSQLEAFTYNIFLLENIADQMELEPKRFLVTCNKIPDFVWEKQKMVIEVAGMASEKYVNKLEGAKKCFSDLGYEVVVLDARKYEKTNKFAEYYLYLCEVFGFEPKKEILNSPYQYMGFTKLKREDLQKFIDDNIGRYNELDRKGQYNLNKYVQELYGMNVRQYKSKMNIPRYSSSVSKQKIIDFKKENPQMTNQQIADYFGVHKRTVQSASVGLPGRKN